ncbi:MAG: FUSC family protein [Flavobacteriales bacterium]|nr:FUSC family protein [Flavobacteriia bacterium]NCP05899.1 FUSC family protein [Flavobacteriales bacterium]PIV94897.1 MAG: FUSC family protein [Flavobacteriaceae bacterium CG17_big_fil_post_rev_8_21_14_2_50_33_15]PIY09953.1 MAG: FUSC family protein [Flavobacteriaceae bacterium CG_4_10_14_3_um_filter_33_47]PJB19557.1 MAG: FUSC family protein [Flavobacteriaceae bacterium CG_4_9_14_3_um_filter_33_16]
MKKIVTIFALILAVLSVIIAVLPVSNLSIFPAIAALVLGILAFYLSKKSGSGKKMIQFIFLLTIISLLLTSYKAIFSKTEVSNNQELKEKEKESKENAIEDLEELDLDDISID